HRDLSRAIADAVRAAATLDPTPGEADAARRVEEVEVAGDRQPEPLALARMKARVDPGAEVDAVGGAVDELLPADRLDHVDAVIDLALRIDAHVLRAQPQNHRVGEAAGGRN